MGLKIANDATSTLASSIIAADTALAVVGGDASKFPSLAAGDWFPLTITDGAGNREIVKVTARSGANMTTIERAQEGTTAQDWAAGVSVSYRHSAEFFRSLPETIADAAEKTTPADDDLFALLDSAASFVRKKLKWSSIKGLLVPTPSGIAQGDILYRGASAWERLAKGSAGQFLRQNAGLTAPEWSFAGAPDIILYEQFAAGSNGGSSVAGVQYRDLNTENRDVRGECTLASRTFTLTAGTYYVEAQAFGWMVGAHRISIFNSTDTAHVLFGETMLAADVGYVANLATLSGVFTIGANKALYLAHRTELVKATDGLGVTINDSGPEKFAMVKLWRIS